MTIIVTGGAGFIGANFVYLELEQHPEDRIVCIDKLTYAGNLETLSEALKNPNFRFEKIDICDREAVFKLFEEENRISSSTSRRRATSTVPSKIPVSSCKRISSARKYLWTRRENTA